MCCIFCLPCFVYRKCNKNYLESEKIKELEWLLYFKSDLEDIEDQVGVWASKTIKKANVLLKHKGSRSGKWFNQFIDENVKYKMKEK